MITTGKFELILTYDDFSTDMYEYDTREDAERAGEGVEMACGGQLRWWCVRPQLVK